MPPEPRNSAASATVKNEANLRSSLLLSSPGSRLNAPLLFRIAGSSIAVSFSIYIPDSFLACPPWGHLPAGYERIVYFGDSCGPPRRCRGFLEFSFLPLLLLLHLLQVPESAFIIALCGPDLALQPRQARIAAVGFTQIAALGQCRLPKLGLGLAQPLELPIEGDERVYQGDFRARAWLKLAAILLGDGFQFGGVLSGDYLRLGVNAELERVKTGFGLPLG
jgi:hypothetical protein